MQQLILKDGILKVDNNVPLELLADIGPATRVDDWEVISGFISGSKRYLISSLTNYTESDIVNFIKANRS